MTDHNISLLIEYGAKVIALIATYLFIYHLSKNPKENEH